MPKLNKQFLFGRQLAAICYPFQKYPHGWYVFCVGNVYMMYKRLFVKSTMLMRFCLYPYNKVRSFFQIFNIY